MRATWNEVHTVSFRIVFIAKDESIDDTVTGKILHPERKRASKFQLC